MPNVTFHRISIENLEEFVKENQLEDKVDLITMGECFHWFDTDKALSVLHRVISKTNGLVAIWGYRYPYFLSQNVFNDCVKPNEKYLSNFDRVIYDLDY